MDYSEHKGNLSDSFDYGDAFHFYDKNKKLIRIKMDQLFLSCEDGGSDTVFLNFTMVMSRFRELSKLSTDMLFTMMKATLMIVMMKVLHIKLMKLLVNSKE